MLQGKLFCHRQNYICCSCENAGRWQGDKVTLCCYCSYRMSKIIV